MASGQRRTEIPRTHILRIEIPLWDIAPTEGGRLSYFGPTAWLVGGMLDQQRGRSVACRANNAVGR
jgi:hypothetical protein